MNLPFVGPRKTARGNGGVLGRVARSTFEAPALWALAEYKVMPHYLAFLCGINLGKRRIKMAHLAALFRALRFTNVETFIASGNVIVSVKSGTAAKLSGQIEQHLHASLGYAVDTFLRTRAELATLATFQPFPRMRWPTRPTPPTSDFSPPRSRQNKREGWPHADLAPMKSTSKAATTTGSAGTLNRTNPKSGHHRRCGRSNSPRRRCAISR